MSSPARWIALFTPRAALGAPVTIATTGTPSDQGWLFDLLRWLGVGPSTAAHLQQVVLKPVVIIAVLLVGALVSRTGSRMIRHWLGAAGRRAAARVDSPRGQARATTLAAMAANVWRVVVWVVTILVALQTVGVDLTPLLAGATVVGATIGFGAQSLVRDLLSGFLLTAEDQFGIGDTIVTGTTTGVVEDVTLRVTRLRARDGTVWFVPNGEIRVVANTSRGWALATMEAIVPVGTDVDVVLETLRTVAESVVAEPTLAPFCLEAPRVWGVVASDDTTFSARVTVRTTALKRDLIEQALRDGVARALRAAGIYEAPGTPGTSGDLSGGLDSEET